LTTLSNIALFFPDLLFRTLAWTLDYRKIHIIGEPEVECWLELGDQRFHMKPEIILIQESYHHCKSSSVMFDDGFVLLDSSSLAITKLYKAHGVQCYIFPVDVDHT